MHQAPRSVAIHENRLFIRLLQHNYSGALDDAHAVETLQPRSARGPYSYCQVFATMGRVHHALQACGQAANAPHDSRFALLSMPGLLVKAGAWTTAMMYADRAVKEMPKSAEAYNERCWVRVRMNDIAGATRDCATALRLSPGAPNIRDTRADIEIRVGNDSGVIADEDAMVAASPASPYGYGGRCLAELDLQAKQRALSDCVRAVHWDSWDGEWLVRLGDAYRSFGRLTDAQRSYELAYSRDPTAFGALRGEAQIAIIRGNRKSATRLARKYVAYNGYDPVGREVYGQALLAIGERVQALSELNLAFAGYERRSNRIELQQIESEIAQAQGHAKQVAASTQDLR
ncbi:MAG: hypothetical protein JO009_02150 [Candidatus Eremiobacteraeota bacterium]|nr:hypothetical protein [Candidatus Eremiobacteraeota bacterium]